MFHNSAGIDLILKTLTWEPVFTSVGKTSEGDMVGCSSLG